MVPVGDTKKSLVAEWESDSVALYGAPTTIVELGGIAVPSEVSSPL